MSWPSTESEFLNWGGAQQRPLRPIAHTHTHTRKRVFMMTSRIKISVSQIATLRKVVFVTHMSWSHRQVFPQYRCTWEGFLDGYSKQQLPLHAHPPNSVLVGDPHNKAVWLTASSKNGTMLCEATTQSVLVAIVPILIRFCMDAQWSAPWLGDHTYWMSIAKHVKVSFKNPYRFESSSFGKHRKWIPWDWKYIRTCSAWARVQRHATQLRIAAQLLECMLKDVGGTGKQMFQFNPACWTS